MSLEMIQRTLMFFCVGQLVLWASCVYMITRRP